MAFSVFDNKLSETERLIFLPKVRITQRLATVLLDFAYIISDLVARDFTRG